jgi:serine/threonine protein phosphatase 1
LKKFLKNIFAGSATQASVPRLPDHQRIYCIGDIHGRADLLDALRKKILVDAAGFEGELVVVYLGDYIDRGPQSREVVETLINSPLKGYRSVHLLGNHEQVVMDFLEHPVTVSGWLNYGGRATLKSYGVKVPDLPTAEQLSEVRDELSARLPQPHLDFFRSLKLHYSSGDYLFVHAGIRPGVALSDQRREDLLWIRHDFTESEVAHPQVVVFGHTIYSTVEFRHNRIGIDTGAFTSGVLTALVLERDEQRTLQTRVGP